MNIPAANYTALLRHELQDLAKSEEFVPMRAALASLRNVKPGIARTSFRKRNSRTRRTTRKSPRWIPLPMIKPQRFCLSPSPLRMRAPWGLRPRQLPQRVLSHHLLEKKRIIHSLSCAVWGKADCVQRAPRSPPRSLRAPLHRTQGIRLPPSGARACLRSRTGECHHSRGFASDLPSISSTTARRRRATATLRVSTFNAPS